MRSLGIHCFTFIGAGLSSFQNSLLACDCLSAAKGRLACSMGLVMIMEKRKCTLETAIAVYNGGWRNRNSKQCKSYVRKVMAIAEKGVRK